MFRGSLLIIAHRSDGMGTLPARAILVGDHLTSFLGERYRVLQLKVEGEMSWCVAVVGGPNQSERLYLKVSVAAKRIR